MRVSFATGQLSLVEVGGGFVRLLVEPLSIPDPARTTAERGVLATLKISAYRELQHFFIIPRDRCHHAPRHRASLLDLA